MATNTIRSADSLIQNIKKICRLKVIQNQAVHVLRIFLAIQDVPIGFDNNGQVLLSMLFFVKNKNHTRTVCTAF